MINDLPRNLIDTDNESSFINNVLVATDTEEGHDELVDEILDKIEKDNLYIKPGKIYMKEKKG